VRRKPEAQPQLRRQVTAELARPQHPQRRHPDIERHDPDRPEGVTGRERLVVERDQLSDLLRVVVGGQRLPGAAHREGRDRVRARRPAESEIDPTRVERLEQGEGLGDLEGRVVRQHHAARAKPDPLGLGGDVGNHDLGCGAGQSARVVVLGIPNADITEFLCQLRELNRRRQSIGRIRSVLDRRQVEERKGYRGCHQ
jgi:hypothetical protein